MNLFWERTFYVLTYIAQGVSFLTPRAYAILHSRHHKYSDTKSDPHSPHHQTSIIKMMIKTFHDFEDIRLRPEKHVNDHTSVDYPVWLRFEQIAESRPVRAVWLLVIVGIYFLISPPAWAYLLVPMHVAIGPIQGAMVNWFGHKTGYVNYKMSDQSKNTLPVDLLLMGELYQNNHHRFPKSINFAKRWFEVDITYFIICFLNKLGVIKLKQNLSEETYKPAIASL